MNRVLLFTICLYYILICDSFGQSEPGLFDNVYVKNITSEDNLSQSNVTSIIKDHEGYIWIGTHDGLNRFDGYNFVIYTKNERDTTSLSDDHVMTLYEDSKNRLWVGTHLGGLNRYDKNSDTFTRYLHDPQNHNSISNNSVLSIVESREGDLWIATLWGLNKFNPETGSFRRFMYKDDKSGIANNEVKSLTFNADSTSLWVATNHGLSEMDLQTMQIKNHYHDPRNPEKCVTNENITSICRDKENNIWIGTSGDGLQKYDVDRDLFFNYKNNRHDAHSLGSNIIQKVTPGGSGEIIIGTDGAGVKIYNPERDNFISLHSRNDLSLSNAAVYEIYDDHDGLLWIGAYGEGVKIAYRQQKGFDHYEVFDNNMLEIGKNSILALAEDNNNNIWIGSDGSGLYKFNPKTREFTNFSHDPDNPNSISSNVVKSLLVDRKGNLYAGTYAGGLNYIDLKTYKVTRYYSDENDPFSLDANHVWSLYQDHQGRIWVGLLGGLQEFIPDEERFITYKADPDDTLALSAFFVSKIFEDSDNNLWIGTEEGGINKLDRQTSTFKRYMHQNGQPGGLSHNHVEDIYEDKNGTLWVGTNAGGLNYYDPEKDNFFKYSTTDELGDAIKSILADENGNFWIGTYKGLCKLNYQNDYAKCYTKIDGIQGNEFNSNAKLRASDGKLYFGGLNGLNIFDPEMIIENDQNYPVVITDLYLFHKEVTPKSHPDILSKQINFTEELVLPPDQNVITLWFSTLEYNFPKKNSYAYKLEGFDNNWNYVDDQRNATYTNLPPGDYTFQVISSNNDGVWREIPKTLDIKVLYPWYQQPFILVLFFVALVALIFAVIKIRTRIFLARNRRLEIEVKRRTFQIELQKSEIEQKNKKLEIQNDQLKSKNIEIINQQEQIAEKNKLLSKAHQEIKKTNEELKQTNIDLENIVDQRTKELRETIRQLVKTDAELNTFLYRSSHDLRGPLATLIGLSNLAKMDINDERYSHYFVKINQSCTNMLGFLKKLDETNTLFKLNREIKKLNWESILTNISSELKKIDPNEKVQKIIEFKVDKNIFSDELIIETIILNLMENAIIFRRYQEPYVKLILGFDGKNLLIHVEDNGIGIDPKIENRIFEMFFRGSEQSHGNGLGLYLVKKAIDVLNGEISLTVKRREKTSFTVKIPIKITQPQKSNHRHTKFSKDIHTIFNQK